MTDSTEKLSITTIMDRMHKLGDELNVPFLQNMTAEALMGAQRTSNQVEKDAERPRRATEPVLAPVWNRDLDDLDDYQKEFWRSPVVQHYILDSISEHYPESETPCWVDRKIFMFRMAEVLFEAMWESLNERPDGKRKNFDCFHFLFAHLSDNIDLEDFEEADGEFLRHRFQFEITTPIWNAYFHAKNSMLSPQTERRNEPVKGVLKEIDEGPAFLKMRNTALVESLVGPDVVHPNISSILIKLTFGPRPDWYRLGVTLVRDDVYDGFQRSFPREMKEIGWKEFWETMHPRICKYSGVGMYVELKDLWAAVSPVRETVVVSKFTDPESLNMDFDGDECSVVFDPEKGTSTIIGPEDTVQAANDFQDAEKILRAQMFVKSAAFDYVMCSLDAEQQYDTFMDCIIQETEMRPTIPSYVVSCFDANARGISDSQDGMTQLMHVGYHCVDNIDPDYFRDTIKALLDITRFEKSHGKEIRTMSQSFDRLMNMNKKERREVEQTGEGFFEYLAEGTSAVV